MAAQLALGALGVTLIYGILRFSNFAHGDTMAFGAMATILFTWWLQSMGLGVSPRARCRRRCWRCPSGIAAAADRCCAGAGTDRVVYRFYRTRRPSRSSS
jgi:branched-chain amino acid transport system permease protein